MTRWVVLLAGCCLTAAVAAPTARAGTVTAECFSPTPFSPTDCASWHNQPVRLAWDYLPGLPDGGAGNCPTPQAFQTEGRTTFSCRVLNPDMSHTTGEVTLSIDRTPPLVTAATPSRPPDVNGWWSRPLSFAFAGTDALSGVASCDTVNYAGPGGPGAAVAGGCHDVAGNYGVASYPVSFDSTPPGLSAVKATPESQSAMIEWTATTDVVRARVTRTTGTHVSASTVVYSGPGDHFTDSGITNGKTYAYTVTVYDPADNSSSRSVRAKPAISLGLKPRRSARLARPPRLRWPAVRHADYYNVQLYRGNHKLLTAWPGGPHLKLRRVLRLHGLHIRLTRGHYRWYVWPGYGSRAAHRYGAFIGQSSFVLVR